MYNTIEFDEIDLSMPAPAQEPERQRWFMKKAQTLLAEKSRELGEDKGR